MAEQAKKKPRRRGSVGVRVYEQVERLTAGKSITRTEALRRIAKQSGKGFGTVAASFYRVARQRGAPLRRKGGGRGRASTGGSADMRRVLGSLRQTAALLRRQEAEISRLRKENERFAEIRKLLGRS
jgi:hypothetical protein